MAEGGMNRLGPAEKKEIEGLDRQLGEVVEGARQGKENQGALFSIAQQMNALCLNQQVPDGIKNKLYAVLHELQNLPEHPNLSNLIQAKEKIDSLITPQEKSENDQL